MSTDVADHYKAVCRALFAEAKELSTFLEKISADKVVCSALITTITPALFVENLK